MELRKDEEEEEKEEEIEEEKEEEEKEDSKEEEKELQKNDQNLNLPQEESPKTLTLEGQKITENLKEQIPKESAQKEEGQLPLENQEQTKNNNNNNQEEQEQEQDQDQDLDLEETSTYILKYTRKGDELKELSIETGLRKSENCLFMLNIKLIKSDSITNTNQNESIKETPKDDENFLVFCCHEIAAIYFDEIYERIYTLKDLANENKYFKVFESIEEAKNVIDETIRTNEKNAKKIFIAFKDKELKLHMKLSFFDKEKEIVLNLPKKHLTDTDKVNLLPEFLKEIQDKMNHLNEENKKLKAKKLKYINMNKEIRNNYKNNFIDEFQGIDKDKEQKNNIINNKGNNAEIKFNDLNGEQINITNNSLTNNLNNINNNSANSKNDNANNYNNINNGSNVMHKKGKKSNKTKKKHLKPEENFF